MSSTAFTNNRTCSSYYFNTSLGDDPFDFRSTGTINRLHQNAIRFGRTSDIGVLYRSDTTPSDKQEYVVGLTMTSLLMFAVITVWFMLIITCMCLGPNRVGIFSGRQTKLGASNKTMVDKGSTSIIREKDIDVVDENQVENFDQNIIPTEVNDGEIVEKYKNEIVKPSTRLSLNEIRNDELIAMYRKRLNCSRIVVLICSVGIVICVVLFIVSGIQNLIQSSNNVVSGVEEGQELATEAVMLLDHFLYRQKLALEAVVPYLEDINGICPNVTTSICDVLTDSRTCDFKNIPLSDKFENAFSYLIDNSKEIVLTQADSIRSDLIALENELAKVSETITSFNWAFAVATVFAVLLLIANLFISYGIIAVWRREKAPLKFDCINKVLAVGRHWLMVPFFVFLVVMSWIFSMIFIIGSIASADLCYNSPDSTVLEILQEDILPLDSIVRDLLIFYVKGCPETAIPTDLSLKMNDILNYTEEILSIVASVNDEEFVNEFVEVCGNDTSILEATATAVEGTICNLGVSLAEVVAFFSCQNWRPLYRVVAYDAVCFNGNKGFYFVAVTQFCIVAFAMIMVTLRAAFKPGVIEQANEEKIASRIPQETVAVSTDVAFQNSVVDKTLDDGQGKINTTSIVTEEEIGNN